MRIRHFLLCLLPLRGVVHADYFDDTGYLILAAALGNVLPNGAGLRITQVEFGDPQYLPEMGTATFAGVAALMSGKSFTAKSGASAGSAHAFMVGEHFYGLNSNPGLGRAGFTPGISMIDLYRVDPEESVTSWTAEAGLTPNDTTAPLTELAVVQNHSWISTGSSLSAFGDNDILRRFDFAIVRDGYLAVTGVNNGASAVPALMASAYNNLAVGSSDGNHSIGGVPSWVNGPGRQKPEITAPLDYTSFSTALVSSAGALLRQGANAQGGAAIRPQTLKAILLAGATKEEFPGWTHTPTTPLDAVFGAGELNIANSWYILSGLEQAANLATARPDFAWAAATLTTTTTADYRLSIPPGFTGEALSAVVCWNRIVRDANPGPAFVMAVDTLADYNLTLARLPMTGSPVVLEESLSTDHNLEHVYRRALPSGTYRLRLSLGAGSNVPASLAWRLTPVAHRPGITLTQIGGQDHLNFTGLITAQSYLVQSSPDLSSWSPQLAFTAMGPAFTWNTTSLAGRRFYRLAATDG